MPERGRPRKPRHLHLVDGTFRKDRDNPNAPTPKSGVPKIPPWLSEDGRKHWKRLAPSLSRLGVLTLADGDALALLCAAAAELARYDAKLVEEGESYESPITSKKGEILGYRHYPHPLLPARADAWRRLMTALSQFGITPAARSKVKAAGPVPEATDPLDVLLRETRSG